MIAGLLKTGLICLTSLGNFDIRTQTGATVSETITSNSRLVNSEDYWTSGKTPSGTVLYPMSYSKSNYWRWTTPSASFYLTEINNLYMQEFVQDSGTFYSKYILNYQNEPYTFGMYLLKIEQTEGNVNNIDNAWTFYISTGLQAITSCNTIITQYEIITENQNITQYWKNPSPITDIKNEMEYDTGDYFNLGSALYKKILTDNEVNYTAKTVLYQQGIPNYAFAPNTDDQILEVAYNTDMYYLILCNFENTSQYTLTTTKPQYIVNAVNSGWTISLSSTQITGTIDYEVIDIPGLCFQILTMPFTFISQAFNVKLFAGTPYQVNISYLFLAIIGIMTFIFIMKKLLGK